MTDQVRLTAENQRIFFGTHQTKEIAFRITQLKTLKKAILAYEDRLYGALWQDLRKSKFEAYGTEIGLVLAEIGEHIRYLKRWSKPRRVATNQLVHFWSDSRIYHEPYGVVLVIAPWNYPFQLLINPLVGAISAGNCITLKASEFTPATAAVMQQMITEFFEPGYISIFGGGRAANEALLAQQWDYIFFTGSPLVGKVVMEAAARHLTPVSLELGGKSPCIVDRDANLAVAASRIIWGKFINAGQTCIAPDYLFVHKAVRQELMELMKRKIHEYFGADPKASPDFARIATIPKTERLVRFLEHARLVTGGAYDISDRYIAPTLIDADPGDPVMAEEIFGPILPVMEFDDLAEPIAYVNSHPKPLALYYFSGNRQKQQEVLHKTSSGGGCINDVLMHIANDKLPFGGVGNSGIGHYHGKYSFEVFSHARSILRKSTLIDVPVRYAPYKNKLRLVKMLIK